MSPHIHDVHPFDIAAPRFTARDNRIYQMCGLDGLRALRHTDQILALHQLIPRVEQWTPRDLLSVEIEGRVFSHKWLLSTLIAPVDSDDPVGVIVAYLRLAESQHPLDAVYIHRMAIAAPNQRRGVGTAALRVYLALIFRMAPWLLNVSVQTNDTAENQGVVRFYERAGFRKLQHVRYPHKTDWLLVARRGTAEDLRPTCGEMSAVEGIRCVVAHPRAPRVRSVPRILISSTSREKRAQFRHIFADYNIDLVETTPPVELTEPQITEASADAELALVRHPLKLVARFLAAGKRTPFLVEDTMLFIEFFNSRYDEQPELPGHDVKRWWRQLGVNGVLSLMGSTARRRAHYVSQLGVYLGRDRYVYARGETRGCIAEGPKVSDEALQGQPGTSPWFFHAIFIPDGSQHTLGEMAPGEFAIYDYRRRAVADLLEKDIFSGDWQLLFRYAMDQGES